MYSTVGLMVANVSSLWLPGADPGFNIREVNVGFAMDKVTLRQTHLPSLRISLATQHSVTLQNHQSTGAE
jgi:hypothetical protein